MVIVLSVFNGLSETIIGQYNKFDAELKVEPSIGKSFLFDSLMQEKIFAVDGVAYCFENIESEALLINEGQQYLATIKGVDDQYIVVSNLKDAIIDGGYNNGSDSFALFGAGVAYYLSLGTNNYMSPVSVYSSKRGKISVLNPEGAFGITHLVPSAIFSLQQDFDVKYVVIPIEQARDLFEYGANEATYVGIYISENSSVDRVKADLIDTLGSEFTVKDRFEQQEMLYKIMKSEKLAIFLILSFILIIAAFNIVSSMTMLIIEKKQDISVLKSLGATDGFVRLIFLFEGVLILVIGVVSGMLLGTLVCYVQKTFNIIKLQGEGSFIIDSYPVAINPCDFLFISITLLSIGLALVIYSIQRLKRHKILDNLQ